MAFVIEKKWLMLPLYVELHQDSLLFHFSINVKVWVSFSSFDED